MNGKCSTCIHRNFREMIKHPYGYSGNIPCLTCIHYSFYEDNYCPVVTPEKPTEKENER